MDVDAAPPALPEQDSEAERRYRLEYDYYIQEVRAPRRRMRQPMKCR